MVTISACCTVNSQGWVIVSPLADQHRRICIPTSPIPTINEEDENRQDTLDPRQFRDPEDPDDPQDLDDPDNDNNDPKTAMMTTTKNPISLSPLAFSLRPSREKTETPQSGRSEILTNLMARIPRNSGSSLYNWNSTSAIDLQFSTRII
jgi:hypothetical protein